MNWTEIPGGRLVGAEQRLRVAWGDKADIVVARINTDPMFTKRIADFASRGGPVDSARHKFVRSVAGNNIWLPEDWDIYEGWEPEQSQLRPELFEFPRGLLDFLNSSCPFNGGKLARETFLTFPGLDRINGSPLTVAELVKRHPEMFFHGTNPWYAGQPYTDKTTMQLVWYSVLIEIVLGSTNKTPEDQAKMLPPEYEVPTTIVETTKDILVFKKTGERPNSSRWAACAERTEKTDKVSAGLVSCVGVFDESGLSVGHWRGSPSSYVGLGASRKFPEL